MIIGIDCGNSYVKVGFFEEGKLKNIIKLPSVDIQNFRIPSELKKLKIEIIAVASVSPSVSKKIEELFSSLKKEILKIKPQDCNIPLNIKNKKCVGIDRVLNCKAAFSIYKRPCIVIDIGTAITIDVVDKKGNFTGGVILPGPELWIKSLETTSLINSPSLLKKNILVGKNTDECITSGINNGISGAIENIVKKLKKFYKNSVVILTGGWCDYYSKKIKIKKRIRKYLTLEGINIVVNERWKKNL